MIGLSEEQDRYLVKALLDGDSDAWEEVSRCVEKWLKCAGKRSYIPREDFNDLRQDILTKLIENNYQRLHGFTFRCRLSSWIGSVVNNHLYDHYRISIRQKTRDHGFELFKTDIASGIENPDELLGRIGDGERVEKAMESLTPSERRVMRMAYWDDLKPSEIARITGERIATVTSRLYRARVRLREILAPSGEEGKQEAI